MPINVRTQCTSSLSTLILTGTFLIPTDCTVHAMQSARQFHFCPPRNLSCLRAIILYKSDYAIQNNLTPFISMQNHHSLIYREEEREMLPTLKVRPPPPIVAD